MATTQIITNPGAIFLTGNPATFRLRSDYYQAGYENFKLALKLTNYFEADITLAKNPVVDGNFKVADFNVAPFLKREKITHFNYPEAEAIVTLHDLLDTVNLVPISQWGPPETVQTGAESEIFYALQGKFSENRFSQMLSEGNNFLNYLTQNKCFLTFAPNPKTIDIYMPEKLYWIAPDAGTYKVWVKKYLATEEKTVSLATFEATKYQVAEIQSSYRKIYGSDFVLKYDVWITDNANTKISEVRTYSVNRTYQKYARYFLALNSFGVFECFRTHGKCDKSLQIKKELIKIANESVALTTSKRYLQSSLNAVTEFEVNSGYLDKAHAAWFQELLISPHVLYLRDDTAFPVIIADSSNKPETDGDANQNMKFKIEQLMHDDFSNEFANESPILPDFNSDYNKDFNSLFDGETPPYVETLFNFDASTLERVEDIWQYFNIVYLGQGDDDKLGPLSLNGLLRTTLVPGETLPDIRTYHLQFKTSTLALLELGKTYRIVWRQAVSSENATASVYLKFNDDDGLYGRSISTSEEECSYEMTYGTIANPMRKYGLFFEGDFDEAEGQCIFDLSYLRIEKVE